MNGVAHSLAAPTPDVAPSLLLQSKIAAVRRKHVGVSCGLGAAKTIGALVLLLAAGCFLDWWLELPLAVRALFLLGDFALVGWIVYHELLRPLLRRPDDDTVALLVEKDKPVFHTRLIASLQLARPGALTPGASAGLVRALIADTEMIAQPLDFNAVIKTHRLVRLAAASGLLLAMGIAVYVMGRNVSRDLLKRAFLSQVAVPRMTRVEVLSGDKVVGRGDAVVLQARARGLVPSHGLATLTFRSGRSQEFMLEADPQEPDRFSRLLENVQDSFTYRITLNDGTSRKFKVEVRPRPEVSFLECYQVYPAYTGLGTVRRALGDLGLLAGSKLQLKANASKDIQSGFIRQVGLERNVALQINRQRPRDLAGEIPIPAKGLNGFSILLTDTQGIKTKDPAVYRIDILPDKPPAVRITYPERKEELVTRQARHLLAFEASDDFAIGKALIRYQVDTLDKGAVKFIELDLGGEPPKNLRRRFEWNLGAMNPSPAEGSIIEYWMEVLDNNNVTGPGIGVSEHYVVKVVSEADKRADLMNRVSDYLGGISEVATDQEKLNQTLGALILEKR